MRMCFDIYDTDGDGEICEGDLLRLIERLDDDIFLTVFSNDIKKIILFFVKKDQLLSPGDQQVEGSKQIRSLKSLISALGGESQAAPKHSLRFEEFMGVEFTEGVPELLEDVMAYIGGFRYRALQTEEEAGDLTTTVSRECEKVRQEFRLDCTDQQLLSLQLAFRRLSLNPANNYSLMYLTQSSILANFVRTLAPTSTNRDKCSGSGTTTSPRNSTMC